MTVLYYLLCIETYLLFRVFGFLLLFIFFGGGDTGGEMEMMGITSLPADVRRSIIYNGNSFGLRIRDHNRDQFDLFTYVCVQRDNLKAIKKQLLVAGVILYNHL